MSQTSLTGPFGLLVCLVASEDCSALLVLVAVCFQCHPARFRLSFGGTSRLLLLFELPSPLPQHSYPETFDSLRRCRSGWRIWAMLFEGLAHHERIKYFRFIDVLEIFRQLGTQGLTRRRVSRALCQRVVGIFHFS